MSQYYKSASPKELRKEIADCQAGSECYVNEAWYVASKKFIQAVNAFALSVPEQHAPWLDQLTRAATSTILNGVEGKTRGTLPFFHSFARVGRASAHESRAALEVAPVGVEVGALVPLCDVCCCEFDKLVAGLAQTRLL